MATERFRESRWRSAVRSRRSEADHNKIAEELKASEQDEKELETFIQNKQEELEDLEGF